MFLLEFDVFFLVGTGAVGVTKFNIPLIVCLGCFLGLFRPPWVWEESWDLGELSGEAVEAWGQVWRGGQS